LLSNQGINIDDILVRWVPYVIGARTSIMVGRWCTNLPSDSFLLLPFGLFDPNRNRHAEVGHAV